MRPLCSVCSFQLLPALLSFVNSTCPSCLTPFHPPCRLTAANLFIEWTVANAAVAKGFSGYFCALTNIDPTIFTPYT